MSKTSLGPSASSDQVHGQRRSSGKSLGMTQSTLSRGTMKSRVMSTLMDVRNKDMKALMRADTHPYMSQIALTKRKIQNPLGQAASAIAVSLCSAVVGFASAYTSPALASMDHGEPHMKPSPQEASWIGSFMPLFALFGGLCGGPSIEVLGRKKTIIATAPPFTLSFLLIGFAVNIPMVMIGRCISGFCVGIASLALPVYLGETLQAEVRGTLGLCPTTFGNFGILLCFLLGTFLSWSPLALFGSGLPLFYFVLMFFVPESPTWYISKNQHKKAHESLKWLRGEGKHVMRELAVMQKAEMVSDIPVTVQEFFTKKYMWPLSISLGLMFFQQFSGINAVIFYTVSIFKDAGSTIDSNLCSIIVGIVNLFATLVATFLIDRLGRKMLLYISEILMSLTLISLGIFFYCKNQGMDIEQVAWIPLTSFVVYVIGFSVGTGPIPWLMMGEILPAKVRGAAASIATAFNWTCTFIVTKTFVDLKEALGIHYTFWIFGFICTCSLSFIWLCVPETQGKSLEDIERKFRGEKVKIRDVRRMSSRILLKPMPSTL